MTDSENELYKSALVSPEISESGSISLDISTSDSTISSSNGSQNNCFICLQSVGDVENSVIPCRCARFLGSVHRDCLLLWMQRTPYCHTCGDLYGNNVFRLCRFCRKSHCQNGQLCNCPPFCFHNNCIETEIYSGRFRCERCHMSYRYAPANWLCRSIAVVTLYLTLTLALSIIIGGWPLLLAASHSSQYIVYGGGIESFLLAPGRQFGLFGDAGYITILVCGIWIAWDMILRKRFFFIADFRLWGLFGSQAPIVFTYFYVISMFFQILGNAHLALFCAIGATPEYNCPHQFACYWRTFLSGPFFLMMCSPIVCLGMLIRYLYRRHNAD